MRPGKHPFRRKQADPSLKAVVIEKKVLAFIFSALVLTKFAFFLIDPQKWLGTVQNFMGNTGGLAAFYLLILIITGYFVFTTLDILDVAVVMLFTGLLVGFSFLPHALSLQPAVQQVTAAGMGKAWLPWILWMALALAVLYRVFTQPRRP